MRAVHVAAARRFAAAALAAAVLDSRHVVWIVSELATNAAVHAQTEFVVSIRTYPLPVRVEIQDWSLEPPVVREPDPDARAGRGMLIVDRLASGWGVSSMITGKRVWFECGG